MPCARSVSLLEEDREPQAVKMVLGSDEPTVPNLVLGKTQRRVQLFLEGRATWFRHT